MKSETGESNASPLLALQRATHATLHALMAELASLDLTPSEVNALANLADGQARTATQLAAATGTRPTTLTGVLDRLERRGHITRGPQTGDRRAVLIKLTEPGRATARTISEAVAGLEGRALAGLPQESLTAFHAVLAALAQASS